MPILTQEIDRGFTQTSRRQAYPYKPAEGVTQNEPANFNFEDESLSPMMSGLGVVVKQTKRNLARETLEYQKKHNVSREQAIEDVSKATANRICLERVHRDKLVAARGVNKPNPVATHTVTITPGVLKPIL